MTRVDTIANINRQDITTDILNKNTPLSSQRMREYILWDKWIDLKNQIQCALDRSNSYFNYKGDIYKDEETFSNAILKINDIYRLVDMSSYTQDIYQNTTITLRIKTLMIDRYNLDYINLHNFIQQGEDKKWVCQKAITHILDNRNLNISQDMLYHITKKISNGEIIANELITQHWIKYLENISSEEE